MILTPAYAYFAEDNVKSSPDNHSRKQTSLGISLRCTTISGVRMNNWANSTITSTLLQSLMAVESITDKKVLNTKSAKVFKGRLFYVIIPNKRDKYVTSYYTCANYDEGRSVARGLPLFIKDFSKIDPVFFCDSGFLAESFQGEWCYSARTFYLQMKKRKGIDRLNTVEDHANAEIQIFISKDHQIALAMGLDDALVETRLTKGDAAPPPIPKDDFSDMTGSTRESKAQRYVNTQGKEVASRYSTQITSTRTDIHDKDDRITQFRIKTSTNVEHQLSTCSLTTSFKSS